MDPLDAAAIRVPGVRVRVVAACASTNSALMAQGPGSPELLAAESQKAGRGRRGRRWHARPGLDIAFSLARPIRRPARELAALSLVAGVAAARALRALGARAASLKWPNDLVTQAGKLGGILVETRTQPGGSLAVVGIGINGPVDASLQRRLRRPVAFMEELVSPMPSRNAVIERIARELMHALDAFEAQGLDAVREEWLSMHAHRGQRLRVRLADGRTMTGIADGLAEDGGLRLRTRSGVRAVRTGRVVAARAA
jgi:BirA family transcriptional regulator, biotin operon repressor / biotin---[acetyl-CoA-carboxylase] ligase